MCYSSRSHPFLQIFWWRRNRSLFCSVIFHCKRLVEPECSLKIIWPQGVCITRLMNFLSLKGQCHDIFDFWFFHESVSPKPLSIPLGPFRIFSKIHGDIRSSRLPPVSTTLAILVVKFATGVVDTGGKFAAAVVDFGGTFVTGVVDTGGALWLANISANILGLGVNWFMKKTRSKKSRDTILLIKELKS